jgi:hypothetical protein
LRRTLVQHEEMDGRCVAMKRCGTRE